MKAKTVIALTIAFLLSSLSVQASEKVVKETLASQGRKHTYYLFVPANFSPTAKSAGPMNAWRRLLA